MGAVGGSGSYSNEYATRQYRVTDYSSPLSEFSEGCGKWPCRFSDLWRRWPALTSWLMYPREFSPKAPTLPERPFDLPWMTDFKAGGLMIRIASIFLFCAFCFQLAFAASPSPAPLRVGIVGLVHGHVHGFLAQSRHSADIEIVGVAEPDAQLLSQAGTRYGF